MFYTVSGNFLIKEIGIELPAGRVSASLASSIRTTSGLQRSKVSKTARC
jgi:hypothetical protein